MNWHSGRVIRLALGVLLPLLQLLPAAAQSPQTTVIHGQRYVKGEIYLSSHEDTLSLKAAGFRNFAFLGRSVGTVRYSALWPVEMETAALPAQVSGLNPDMFPPQAEEPEWMGEALELERLQVLKELLEPQYLSHGSGAPSFTKDQVRKAKAPDYRREWLEREWARQQWEITTKRPVRKPAGKRPTGTFITQPVEDGPFHKPQNVVKRDPHLTGNFQVPPIDKTSGLTLHSYESMRPDFPLPNTGTFLTSPTNPPRRSIGVRPQNWPVRPTPREYRGTIQGPRRRP